MSTRISITDDIKRSDNISIFHLEPIFLIICDRNDINNLRSIHESKTPGIYILLSANRRYVGQASVSVLSRLEQHNINKDWWDKVIFFGRIDENLPIPQLNFMEKHIIKKFNDLNIKLDNNTMGNDSNIDINESFKATKILDLKNFILNKYTRINLYGNNDTSDTNAYQLKYVKLLGKRFYGSANREIFLDIIAYLIDNGYLNKLSSFISETPEPTYSCFIGTESVTTDKGNKLTKNIQQTKYYIYVNYSKRDIISILKKISHILNVKISINI